MRCIIIDENILAREGLRMSIDELHSLDLVGEFETLDEAKKFLSTHIVDLIFLDVLINGKNSIEFVKKLDISPLIIFTTIHSEYAVQSYEVNAVDYLVKPIKFERLKNAVGKAEKLAKIFFDPAFIEGEANNFVFIKSERKLIKIKYDDLLYVEGLKDYVIVHCVGGKYVTAMNIKAMMSKLPEALFFRVSKSFIVNVNHIDDINGNSVNINGFQIPIGKVYKDLFLDYINNRLLKK